MQITSAIQSIFYATFHDWHWHKENYIAAATALLSFAALVFSILSSKRAILFSQTTQLLSLSDKFLSNLPKELDRTEQNSLTGNRQAIYVRPKVEKLYSLIVTFIETVNNFKLDDKSVQLTYESFWLQCEPFVWDEISKGAAAKFICSAYPGTETLSNHRKSLCDAFNKVIKKHKGEDYPINDKLDVRKNNQ